MASFDMRGQHVSSQYIAGQDINFSTVQTYAAFIATLEQLREQVTQANEKGIINTEVTTSILKQLNEASHQSRVPTPDKSLLLEHLSRAKDLLESITAASGLVTAFAGAIQATQRLFS